MIDYTLYVITDNILSQGREHAEVARAAIQGGATVIQFRDKALGSRALLETAGEIKALCKQAGIPFIANDRLDIALAVDADGLHLGQEDLPAAIARKFLGKGKILGVSATNLDEALQAEAEGADYLGVGPIFATGTKPDAAPPMGVEELREVVERVSMPVVAIGGIGHGNVSQVIAAGADGVAVISAVVSAPDIAAATAELLARIRVARGGR